ncbi:RNA 2'-phosphotransferase [Corallococcus sp. M34]|uniref:RNA 2'-phosphotransferase n=1 Tax=Citreicoccus inhibens TaxID=2849499 RepID=UPI001C21EF3E|nr:RNA 2'-phosphotransferase [Citreicoccus inhibens]MBU8900891.1 RNA 2'-phosphotransferase [Citreicoccus inhibens]
MSKFLSLILRHQPEQVGVHLDAQGWVERIAASSAKRQFAVSEDGLRIRANQGHSVAIDLAYPAAVPPAVLYHGTPEANVERIRKDGLLKMQRHHVQRERSRFVRRGLSVEAMAVL